MSRIDELIAELAPRGALYCRVGDIFVTVKTPRGIKRSDYSLGTAIPIVDQGQSLIAGYTDNDSLEINDGPYVVLGDHTRAVKWVDFPFAVGADGTKVLKAGSGVLPKYAYYATASLDIPDRGYNRHWTIVRDLRIPVPPLEIQREIVRILDQFTQLKTELEAALEAELETRRQQHAYYCQMMLTRIDAEPAALASLGKWQGGITPSKSDGRYWTRGNTPWLASMDVSDESTNEIRGRVTELALQETSLKVVPAPSIAVVMRSNILRRTLPIGLIHVDTTVNQDIRALIPREGVDAAYVYEVLKAGSDHIRRQCVRTDGSMAAVSSRDFFAWEIPLPSLKEQQRIATEFQVFDAFASDLAISLTAELEARRQQYEHYRDELLTFPEAPS